MNNNHRYAICIGAQKAGTTTLYEIMARTEHVEVTSVKETGFFSKDDLYARGHGYYESTYFSAKGDSLRFEADPDYLFIARSAPRIYSFDPNVRLIVILRDPVARAYSQYQYMKNRTHEPLSFLEAIEVEEQRCAVGEWERNHFGYIARSRYAEQIERLLEVFPREQVFFVRFEEFTGAQESTIQSLFDWLGLPGKPSAPVHENNANTPRSLLIARFLHSRQLKPLRSAVGALLPIDLRSRLAHKLHALNSKKGKASRPDESGLLEAFRKLEDDIRRLPGLTGIDIDPWLRSID